MKIKTESTLGALALIALAQLSQAQPELNVGSADHLNGPCYGAIVVGPPGGFVPFLDGTHGVIFTQLGDGKLVYTNSKTGGRNLTCHGRIEFGGDDVAGLDIVTEDGVLGTPVGIEEACDALAAWGLDHACKGESRGAIILDADFNGGSCNVDGVTTDNWRSVYTRDGRVMLSCHADEK
jgi:hypothetical protein